MRALECIIYSNNFRIEFPVNIQYLTWTFVNMALAPYFDTTKAHYAQIDRLFVITTMIFQHRANTSTNDYCYFESVLSMIQMRQMVAGRIDNNPFIPNIIIHDSIESCLCWCLCCYLIIALAISSRQRPDMVNGLSMKCSSKLKLILGYCSVGFVSGFDFRVIIAFWIKCENIDECRYSVIKSRVNAQTVIIVKNSEASAVEYFKHWTLNTLPTFNIIVHASFVQFISHFTSMKNELGIQNSEVAPLLSTS